MGDFTMPSLGADMEAGTVAKWLVKPGDEVHRGDIVAVVETEKSTIEVEVFDSGVVDELVVPEGERVPVGTVMARIRSTAAAPVARRAVPVKAPAVGRAAAVATVSAQGEAAAAGQPRAIVHSPVVRRLADQLHVDLSTVTGSGLGGTVTRADVARAASEAATAPPAAVPAKPAAVPARAAGVPAKPAAAQPPGGRPAAAGRRRPGRRRGAGDGAPVRPRSSPLARRLAAALGVDLASLRGTGPDGAVVEDDVRRAAAGQENAPGTAAVGPQAHVPGRATPVEPPAHVPTGAGDKQAAMRRAIGALMARSKREIPHYYLSTTIDVGAATGWLEQANLERPVTSRLVLPALLVKATALAVAKVPEMNGFFVDDELRPSAAVHVGVAIALRSGGVIAPAIHDADRRSLDELMTDLRDLVGRARSGVLRSSEMSDPTITVSNLGELGVESVFGVIYPPQVALVGFGQVTDRAVARDGMLGVRPCLTATLSADHRASDGHRGGRFLAEIDHLLQEPEHL